MKINIINGQFSVLKLNSFDGVDLNKEFCFACKSDKEYSLVCRTFDAPERFIDKKDGFSAMRIDGALDFSLVGILADITSLLAKAYVPVFAVSTYDTDYILVDSSNLPIAVTLLKNSGYEILTD